MSNAKPLSTPPETPAGNPVPGGPGHPVADRGELAAAYREALGEAGLGAAHTPNVGTTDPGLSVGQAGTAVSAAALAETAATLLRMVDRAAGRSLYNEALRATGGDRRFADELASRFAWSDAELTEVSGLVRQVAEMYSLTGAMRPDVILLLACGMHAAGFLTLKAQIKERAAKAKALAAAANQSPA